MSGRALYSRSCTGAQTSWGGSSWQRKDKKGSHCRTCVLAVIGIRLRSTSCWFRRGTATAARRGRSNATGGARHAAASTIGGTRTESWLYRTARTAARRRCFGPTPCPKHLRENLVNALTLLANQQTAGDSFFEVHVEGSFTTKQGEDDRRAEKVRHGGEPRGGKHWPLGKDLGVSFSL